MGTKKINTYRYLIFRNVLCCNAEIEISESYYNKASIHFNNLKEMFFIEDKFDMMLGNYCDFETELLKIATENSLYRTVDMSSINNDRRLMVRKFVNLLFSCNLYLDHFMQHIESVFGNDSKRYEDINNKRKELHKKNFSFRLMYFLRNYMAHGGLPIILRVSQRNVGEEKCGRFESSSSILLDLKSIKADGKARSFSKKFFKELSEIDEDVIDIKRHYRKYVECICNLNSHARKILSPFVELWEATLKDVSDKYIKKYGDKEGNPPVGLAISKVNKLDNQKIECKEIFFSFIQDCQMLINKNKFLDNVSLRYSTGRIDMKEEFKPLVP